MRSSRGTKAVRLSFNVRQHQMHYPKTLATLMTRFTAACAAVVEIICTHSKKDFDNENTFSDNRHARYKYILRANKH